MASRAIASTAIPAGHSMTTAEPIRIVVPPRYPALDLPFSLVADTLLIPMLFPAAIVTSFTHRAN